MNNILFVVSVVLIVLKLTGLLAISWFLALLPLFIGTIVVIVTFVLVLLGAGIVGVIGHKARRFR